jgi:predicted GIY-YIG superfamily endonuclease
VPSVTEKARLPAFNSRVTNRARNYFFYIMASRSRTLYCGVTSNLVNRVWQHKAKEFDGFTAKYNIERLVLFERYGYTQCDQSREAGKALASREEAVADRTAESNLARPERRVV